MVAPRPQAETESPCIRYSSQTDCNRVFVTLGDARALRDCPLQKTRDPMLQRPRESPNSRNRWKDNGQAAELDLEPTAVKTPRCVMHRRANPSHFASPYGTPST